MRCLSAWNEPITRPNCLRSCVYCTVASSTDRAVPTCSAVIAVQAAARRRERKLERVAIAVAAAPANSTRARVRVGSMTGTRVTVTPSAEAGSSKSPTVSPVTATTSRVSAVSAPRTWWAVPVRVEPSAVTPGAAQPSRPAQHRATCSPAAIEGSRRAEASASPAASTACAARTAEPSIGDGVSRRPSSSHTRCVSTKVAPAPSCSSGIDSAAAPICSTSVDHRAGSKPSAEIIAARTASESDFFSSSAATDWRRAACSSVSTPGVEAGAASAASAEPVAVIGRPPAT